MTWHTGKPPRQGEYLVVRAGWRFRAVAPWRPDLGWCVNGVWCGHDGVECWQEIDDMPLAPKEEI